MSQDAADVVRLSQVSKWFTRGTERIDAVRDVSLVISEGDFVAISGPSGSGKSTLLYLIGLLDVPSAGSYHLFGRETAHLSDDDRSTIRSVSLGFIFQSFHLLPRASALENVMMPMLYHPKLQKLSRRDMSDRARDALGRVGLSDREKHLPNELSGGQRQRVAIARAIVHEPALILADEPTGNLDPKSSRIVIDLLHIFHRGGATVVLVTHDAAIAAEIPRLIQVRDGVAEVRGRAV